MSATINQGEQKVTVELTLKEAMALTGFRFGQNSRQHDVAREKVRKALDKELFHESNDSIRYEELAH
ncbi:hypothetical protein [Gorillibacterium sp. sgz5001074]|uniref:hypothetical protein n=1 Tax=Gorillibacterium sp. sgz5001074 TaxID=3446695 RepID=UPI003F6791AC